MSRWLTLLFQLLPSIISPKTYPTVDSQNAKLVAALGNVCSATGQLPTSTVLSAGLKKRGSTTVAPGAFTDVWQGEYYATQVAIKSLRIYPTQNCEEAKKVTIQPAPEVSSKTRFSGPMETSADVEKAIP